jgi:hypothetical protein
MREIELIDHLGDYWLLLLPAVFEKNRNGMMIMWVYVGKGPEALRNYQEIPLPVFTEWWDDA